MYASERMCDVYMRYGVYKYVREVVCMSDR